MMDKYSVVNYINVHRYHLVHCGMQKRAQCDAIKRIVGMVRSFKHTHILYYGPGRLESCRLSECESVWKMSRALITVYLLC